MDDALVGIDLEGDPHPSVEGLPTGIDREADVSGRSGGEGVSEVIEGSTVVVADRAAGPDQAPEGDAGEGGGVVGGQADRLPAGGGDPQIGIVGHHESSEEEVGVGSREGTGPGGHRAAPPTGVEVEVDSFKGGGNRDVDIGGPDHHRLPGAGEAQGEAGGEQSGCKEWSLHIAERWDCLRPGSGSIIR